MLTYKATQIISKLTPHERELFKEYLSLPSTKCKPQVLELYRALHSNGNESLSNGMLKKTSRLQPKRIPDLMYKLLQHLKEFGTWLSIKKSISTIERERYWLMFLTEKNLPLLYQQHFRNTKMQFEAQEIIAPIDYLNYYTFFHQAAVYEKIVQGRKLSIPLSKYLKYLDWFYCVERLKLISEGINRTKINNSDYIDQINELLKFTARFGQGAPLVKIYKLVINNLKMSNPKFSNYDKLYQAITSFPVTPSASIELMTLSHYLINLTLVGLRKDVTRYMPKFKSLIKWMETSNLLLERNYISPPIFKLLVSVGLKNGELSWTKSIIHEYGDKLHPSNKLSALSFCTALVLFYENKYSEAKTMLDRVKQPDLDMYFKLNIRTLRLQILVQQNIADKIFPSQTFYDMLRVNMIFLRKAEKIDADKKREVLRLHQFLGKFARKFHRKKNTISLKSEILKTNAIAEKAWLLTLF